MLEKDELYMEALSTNASISTFLAGFMLATLSIYASYIQYRQILLIEKISIFILTLISFFAILGSICYSDAMDKLAKGKDFYPYAQKIERIGELMLRICFLILPIPILSIVYNIDKNLANYSLVILIVVFIIIFFKLRALKL